MTIKRGSLILLTLFLVGCSSPSNIGSIPNPTQIPSTATIALPTIPKMGTVIVFTYTPKPPTLTPSPTPPFDISAAITSTPSAPEKCPLPGKAADLSTLNRDTEEPSFSFKRFETKTLDYLNQGGSPSDLIVRLRQQWDSYEIFGNNDAIADLTGDGVPEIVIMPASETYILGCQDGKYQILFKYFDEAVSINGIGTQLVAIQDMNLNGIPEFVFASFGCGGMGTGQCLDVYVYEWNGKNFTTRIPIWEGYEVGASIYGGRLADYFPGVTIKDVDNNGTKELIITGGIPNSWYSEHFYHAPWRDQTDIYKWNGENFVHNKTTFSSPIYRYQAIQDGDRQMQNHEYDQALKSYQEAIFSDKLLGWSQAHKDREKLMHDFTWDFEEKLKLTPTPSIPPDDPKEYPNLAAYGRYRIMLLHILQGNMNEARIVYETLQEKFPEGSEGHIFAQVAKAFWEEYNASQSVSAACQAAIHIADENQGVLEFLGSDYGNVEQDLLYKPEDVCPFQ